MRNLSDEFFSTNQQIFDIIFIDGLHPYNQAYRDINNSLLYLSNNGYIVCHDMLPPSEAYQHVPPTQSLWTGDCWKAWVTMRGERTDLQMHTVDTDYGCGIISKGSQTLINIQHYNLTWNNFTKHKHQWMNIVSVQEFREIYL